MSLLSARKNTRRKWFAACTGIAVMAAGLTGIMAPAAHAVTPALDGQPANPTAGQTDGNSSDVARADATVHIRFIDDVTGDPVSPKPGFNATLKGKSGDTVKFSQKDAEKGFDTTKYKFVSMTNVSKFTKKPQTITVRLGHQTNTSTVNSTRTISYVGVTPAIANHTDTIAWTKTTDAVTGALISCTTTSAGYPQVDSPTVTGYTANPTSVPAEAAASNPTKCPPSNTKVTVKYTKVPKGTVMVVFYDDDSSKPVPPTPGFNAWLTGYVGSPVGFTANDANAGFDASKYVYKSIDNVDTFTKNQQIITVHLTHKMETTNVDVTRTINYTGAGKKTPADHVDTITWLKTTDLVTNKATCSTTATGYPQVDSPYVRGYTADPKNVPATTVTSPAKVCPANTTVTVKYTPKPTSINIVFYDDDAKATVPALDGFDNTLTGDPGDRVNFTNDDAKAGFDTAKYVLNRIDNVTTFTQKHQTIVVHLKHKVVTADVDVTRTIHYVGADAKTPADVVQTVTWTKTTDLVTKVSTCTTKSAGYPAVKSPIISGYTVDTVKVPAQAATPGDTCPPANTKVVVTYTKAPATMTVNTGGSPVDSWPTALAGSMGLLSVLLLTAWRRAHAG